MSKPKIRRWYDRVGLPIEEFAESRTKQAFVDECDINRILSRYRVTGLMRQVPGSTPMYGDFSSLPDYQAALNVVIAAQDTFSALSSDVRTTFDNDPAKFVQFASDPANIEQMRKWGFAVPASSGGEGGPPPSPEGTPVDTPASNAAK